MKKILIISVASLILVGCNSAYKKTNDKEKLHNKGVAIETHAPTHANKVTQETARRASDVSNIAIEAGLK